MDFDKIKYFLEDEINSDFKDYYYDIASELSGMITLRRDNFDAFEELIIFIYQKGELLIFLTPHVIDDQILDGSNQEEIDLVLEKKKNQ